MKLLVTLLLLCAGSFAQILPFPPHQSSSGGTIPGTCTPPSLRYVGGVYYSCQASATYAALDGIYSRSFTLQTAITSPASAHGQVGPQVALFDASGGLVTNGTSYSGTYLGTGITLVVATNGMVTMTFSPAFSGSYVIFNGGSALAGPATPIQDRAMSASTPTDTNFNVVVGAGASLTFASTGVVNASQLGGAAASSYALTANLGTAAFQPATMFDTSGAANTAQAASLQKALNLSDLANTATTRTNLGLAPVASSGSYTDLLNNPAIPAASGSNPAMNGTAAAGSSASFSRSDHVHPADTNKQPLISGAPGTWPTLFAPVLHASTHASSGSDPISLSASQMPNAGLLTGDVTGTFPATTVSKINGITISGTPALGYVPTATSATAATWQVSASGGAAVPATPGMVKSTGTALATAVAGTDFQVALPDIADNGSLVTLSKPLAVTGSVTAANVPVPVPATLGNGVTDQTVAIQAILDANQTSTIRFSRSAGCYMVLQIKVYSGQTIEGTDQNTCIQRIATTAANGDRALIIQSNKGVPLTNFTIQNITLDGNRANQVGISGDGNGMDLALYGPTNVTLSNVTMLNAYTDALYVTGTGTNMDVNGDGLRIINCILKNSRRNNASFISANNILISGTRFEGAGTGTGGTSPKSGIDFEPNIASQTVTNVSISGSTFVSNANTGIALSFNFAATPMHLIVAPDNLFMNQGQYDFYASSTGGFSTSGITVGGTMTGATFGGMFISHCQGCVLSAYNIQTAGEALRLDSNDANTVIGPGVLSGLSRDLGLIGSSVTGTVISQDALLVHGSMVNTAVGTSGLVNRAGQVLTSQGDLLEQTYLQFSNGSVSSPFTGANPAIYGAASGGVYPFVESGSLVLQSRGDSYRDIVFMTGASHTVAAVISRNQMVGIGTNVPTSPLQVVGLPVFANNAAAITGGLTAGAFYRSAVDPDAVQVVGSGLTSISSSNVRIGPVSGSGPATWRTLAAVDIPASLASTTSVNGTAIPASTTIGSIWARGTLASPAAATTVYAEVVGSGTAFSTEVYQGIGVPVAGKLNRLCASIQDSQPGTGSLVVTLRVNSASPTSGLVVTIPANSSAGVYCDNAHTVAVNAADLINLMITNNASTSTTTIKGVTFYQQ